MKPAVLKPIEFGIVAVAIWIFWRWKCPYMDLRAEQGSVGPATVSVAPTELPRPYSVVVWYFKMDVVVD